MKRVVIVGGAGRMGQALAKGLGELPDFKVATLIDVREPSDLYGATYAKSLSDNDGLGVDVVVDFSAPESVVASAHWCATHKVGLVIGTTGLSAEQRSAVDEASTKTGVIMASNFAIGAALSERFAAMAAPYFDRVEIIELHHDKKVDAPSGTSLAAARAISDARTRAGLAAIVDPTTRHSASGARGADGGDGIRVHSVRLPGLVAHQEILFGGPGEGLTIRHDSFDRMSFVHGVALAARAVNSTPKLTIGVESLIP
ncbi:MAG: 4-hydroxy-tetrahydrodipicolinate reductase [Acidimicrobiales bacterium]